VKVPAVLGSYVPGDTPVHRVDPRVKLLLAVALVFVVFLAPGWSSLILLGGLVASLTVMARVPRGWLRRSLTPLMPLLMFTWVLNAFAASPSGVADILVAIGPLAVHGSGIVRGTFVVVRISVMILGTALLALTTSPRALADAMAFFARPLSALRVPVDDLAMMMTIALRFLPTLAEELATIVRARMARGADFSGSPLARAKVWATVLVPLFIGLFRRADELATAMEARGYHGGGPRPRLHPAKATPRDAIALGLGAVAMAAAMLAGRWL
jgi:energy-coupling factor transport system permease protein